MNAGFLSGLPGGVSIWRYSVCLLSRTSISYNNNELLHNSLGYYGERHPGEATPPFKLPKTLAASPRVAAIVMLPRGALLSQL